MTTTLETPLQLGPITLANRILMAPMTRGRAGDSRIANDIMAEYYRQRASAGLIITEATAISEEGYGWLGAPALYNEEQQQGWKKVTDTVHSENGRIFLQLWHMGRVSHPDFLSGNQPIGPSALAAVGETNTPQGKKPYVVPRQATEEDLARIIDQYGLAAKRAIMAGFDGVEIHSANGYFLDQFLRDGSNKRKDQYGGSIENRMRFPLQVVDAVISAVGNDRVGLRISPVNQYNDMKDSNPTQLFSAYAAELSKRNLVYLHVLEAVPGHFLHVDGEEKVLPSVRNNFTGTIIANGGYQYQNGNELIASGMADAIAFGIPFLANPDLPSRMRNSAPLNSPDMNTFYSPGEKGYTDYPILT